MIRFIDPNMSKSWEKLPCEILCSYFISTMYDKAFFSSFIFFNRKDNIEYIIDAILKLINIYKYSPLNSKLISLYNAYNLILKINQSHIVLDSESLDDFYDYKIIVHKNIHTQDEINFAIEYNLKVIYSMMVYKSLKFLKKQKYKLSSKNTLVISGNTKFVRKIKKFIKKDNFFLSEILLKPFKKSYDIKFNCQYFLFKLFFANELQFRNYNINDIRSTFLASLSKCIPKHYHLDLEYHSDIRISKYLYFKKDFIKIFDTKSGNVISRKIEKLIR